jgi:FAD dependent monooxygenase
MINIHHIEKPSNSEIDARLSSFNKSRIERTMSMAKTAGFVTRLQARDGLVNRLIGRYFAPYAGDLPADMTSNAIIGATKLDYIPTPGRSEKGISFQKAGRDPCLIRRMLKASVFLILVAIIMRMLIVNTSRGQPE